MAGNSNAAKMPMTAMTTRSSTSVNAVLSCDLAEQSRS
jgi:hypothetical protein